MYILYTLIIPLVVAAICAFLSRNSKMCAYVAVAGMTLSAIIFTANWFIVTSTATSLDALSADFGLSSTGLIVAYPVIIIGTLITWFSLAYINNARRFYYPLLLVIIGTTATAVICTNVAALSALLEISTLSTAILVTYRKGPAFEAATKYIVLNSIGGSFTLIALILMFVSYGTLDIASFGSIPSNTILLISLFLLIGLGTKIGAVPMHSWVPDTYGESPIPISAFLAGTVKGASAFILLRLFFSMHPALDVVLLFVSITALLTVGVGAIMAYTQKDLKRFLAYSSIEQAGIILFAVGIGSSAALAGGIFQIVNNMVMKTLLFLCVGAIIAATKQRDIDNLGGLVTKMPIVAAGFIVGALALSGIPPLNGFISEYMILQAGFQKGGYYPALSVLLLALTLPMFAAYIKVFQRTFLAGDESREAPKVSYLSIYIIIPIIILAVLCVLMGIFPTAITEQVNNLAIAILGG